MIVREDKAKELLVRIGLPAPRGRVAQTPDEAADIARELGGAGVVKALIPGGGRGKAGGVKICASLAEVQRAASELLGTDLLGHTVQNLLVEELMPVQSEIYGGVLVNAATNKIDLIVSMSGGIDIEVQAKHKKGILHLPVDPGDVLPAHRLRWWLQQANIQPSLLPHLASTLVLLHRAAVDLDARLLEVNPLALVKGDTLVALDCKLEIDDNALVRQPELARWYFAGLTTREKRARELGVSFVPLKGNIGVITSGAGLGMATLDLLKRASLTPANFLDTGGGISKELVQGALELVMEPTEIKGAIINLYGGINRMLEAAKGIVAARQHTGDSRPVVVKILGNQQEEAWAMLEKQPGIYVIKVTRTETAVNTLAHLVR